MRTLLLLLLTLPLLAQQTPVTTIAAGSCYKPEREKGLLTHIHSHKPQLFLFLGDNIYADTDDMDLLKTKYQTLLNLPAYQKLTANTKILPIWDDHDYGKNDAGAEYPKRQQSQQIFLDTFNFPADHPARKTPGIYHAHTQGPKGKRLQIISLDTRYHRSPLIKGKVKGRNGYLPQTDPTSTILGEQQWQWLEKQLQQPADLRLITSSIQILNTAHRFEKWSNIPAERTRLINLLHKTKTKRVLLLSGDRHLAEISRLPAKDSPLPYDLLELTTSGMTHAGAPNDPHPLRIQGSYYSKINYATLHLDWTPKIPTINITIRNNQAQPIHNTLLTFPN